MSNTIAKGPIQWMASHGVAPNILMIVFILGGLFMTTQIKQEIFPQFEQDSITIMVPFPGSGPEEVEEGVILSIEEAVRGVEGVKEVSSTAAEGRGIVIVEILASANLQQVSQDLKQAVDQIDTFPEDTREESISVSSWRRTVVKMQLYGDVTEWTLRQAAEHMRDGLLQHPGITQVEFRGAREMEIHIEIPLATLREYGLTLTEIARVIRNSALDRSGGSIETSSGEILLRVQERREWAREYGEIPIISLAAGDLIRLGDIATIREGFEDTDTFATFDGMRAIDIRVSRTGNETPIGVSDAVTESLPVGASPEDAVPVRDLLVKAAEEVLAQNGGDALGKGVSALVEENKIEVRAYLVESSIRDLSTAEVTNMWRDRIGGDIPGLEMLRFAADAGGPGRGPKLSVELSHRDVPTLERAAEDLAKRLSQFASVKDLDDGFAAGKVQLDFKANDEARTLGLDASSIARQVRASFYGVEPIRQQRGRNEVTVKVRLPESERSNEADVENLVLFTPNGGEVPLYQVAEVKRGRAYTSIERKNGKRVVTVTANIEPVSEVSKVLAMLQEELLPAVIANYPGLTYSFEGRQADMRDSMQAFYYTCSIALFVIFILLAIPFRSYLQPLIVMTAIPFAVVGAIIGHLIMGFSLSIISLMGIIALSGVVINGGLVMVDFANKKRQSGLSPHEAVKQAGIRRFRPILLTTMTTFGGLAPMILETSRQARFLVPMAVSLGYGIVFATCITLVLVPCLYIVIEDIVTLPHTIRQILTGRPPSDDQATTLDEVAK